MNLRRRRSFVLVATAALMLGSVGCDSMSADSNGPFPSGDLTMVVPFSPGGPTDLAVRSLAPLIEAQTERTVVVENKAGATGTIGMNYVINSQPDGLTSAITCTSSAVVVPVTQENPPYTVDDFRMVGSVTAGPIAFLVQEDSEYSDINALLDAAEAAPDELTIGTSGANSHNSLELRRLAELHGPSFTEVPAEGNSAVTAALLAGDIDAAFISLSDEIPQHIDEGSLRMLAVASEEQNPEYPDVPTLAESGYDDMVNGESACGIAVPADTPDDIVDEFSTILRSAIDSPEFAEAVGEEKVVDPFLAGNEMSDYFQTQVEAYADLTDVN